MERFAKIAANALSQILETPVSLGEIETPPDPNFGDFGFPCFKLSKAYRKGPPQVAQDLVARINEKKILPADITCAAVGPYVNFTVKPEALTGALLSDILKGAGLGTYGSLEKESRETWVLEFSSLNVAKPFQIYHQRPTMLGAALDRIGRFRGFKMVSINHLGDWGVQYGKLSVAFKLFANDLPEDPTIRDLESIYVKFHEAAEKDPSLEDQAREAFVKLENDDAEMIALWKKCVDISLREFFKMYDRLDVKFDHIWGESYYKHHLTPLLKKLREMGLLVESEGAQVVHVTDEQGRELPPCLLQKSDGSSIYATRDVAAALYRYEKFKFQRMTYIVGGEQKLHFQQVFSVLKQMGCEWVKDCEHTPTGLFRFNNAKMSTRKGNVMNLESVIDLAKDRVRELMQERAKDNDEPIDEVIVEKVGLGAVVFHDLHNDPARDVEFDVNRIVDFEGETGPYLQYAHTRCLSILRKARDTKEWKGDFTETSKPLLSKLQKKEEIALIKALGQFPLYLERTLTFNKASQLAHYLIDVTKQFGVFYRECHVLGQEPELTQARLYLVEATRRILAQGLGLLGVPLPDSM